MNDDTQVAQQPPEAFGVRFSVKKSVSGGSGAAHLCLFDAHCHLADERLDVTREAPAAQEAGVTGFLSCALSDAEMDWHLAASVPAMRWCAGVAPWWPPSTPALLPRVERLAESGAIIAVGEIGLDRRGDLAAQYTLLDHLLALAADCRLPVVLHCVRAWQELRDFLKKRHPRARGFIHGFNAPADVLEAFRGFDLAFSLGGGVSQRPDAAAVLRAALQYGRLLLETDAPWQLPRWLQDDFARPAHLPQIARRIAELGGIPFESFVAMQDKTWREWME